MAAAHRAALAQGWAEARIHSEAFQPVATPAACAEENTFNVILASSGERWPVPAHKTIAQVLQENGIAVPSPAKWGFAAPA